MIEMFEMWSIFKFMLTPHFIFRYESTVAVRITYEGVLIRP